jgi:hypothetical protein
MKPFIQIGDDYREMTEQEHAEYLAACDDVEKAVAQAEADRKAKEQVRAAVLAKLGLTADEAAALLG